MSNLAKDEVVALQIQLAAARAKIAQLEHAVDSSRRIGPAVGILMVRHQITAAEAFQRMSRWGRDHARKVIEVAEQVTWAGDLPDEAQK